MKRQPRLWYDSGITRFEERSTAALVRRPVILMVVALLLLWLAIPVARSALLLWTGMSHHSPAAPHGLSVQPVRFHASDGVSLRGWFVPYSAHAPSIILVAGFKADRTSMISYARFLHAGDFNVLLYDSRGTGGSGGTFSLGLYEVRDVLGAASFLSHRTYLLKHNFGLLGVSMGAGDVIVGGSKIPDVRAIVADSPYVNQDPLVQRLDTLRLGPLSIPLAPIAPTVVDRFLGGSLASFSPLRRAAKLHGRGLLLINSRHDQNPTTPMSAALALKRAAGSSASIWAASKGAHAEALTGQPTAYRKRVITFFNRYLRSRPAKRSSTHH